VRFEAVHKDHLKSGSESKPPVRMGQAHSALAVFERHGSEVGQEQRVQESVKAADHREEERQGRLSLLETTGFGNSQTAGHTERRLLLADLEGQACHKGTLESADRNSEAVGRLERQSGRCPGGSGAGHMEQAWSLLLEAGYLAESAVARTEPH